MRVSKYSTTPPISLTVAVQGYGTEGLVSITVVESVNALVDIPDFAPGTEYVEVTATRIDPALPARMTLKACPCECTDCCHTGDPALTELRIAPGASEARDRFEDIGAAERFVTVQNGELGVRWLHVSVDGRLAQTLRLHGGEVQTVDLGRWMGRAKNVVAVAAQGPPGASALVVVSDASGIPGPIDGGGERPAIAWRSAPAAEEIDLHWGR